MRKKNPHFMKRLKC